MLTQTSVHSKVSPASPEPDGLNYNFTYQYNGPRPHAATRIGNWAYLYDANGNVIEQQWIGDQGEGHGNDWGGDNHGGSQSMNLAPAAPTSNASPATNDQGGPGNGERDAHGNFRYGDHRYGGEHGSDWGMQNPHYGQGGGPKDQTFVWDEENRLIHSYGFGGPTDYLYDYNGERALKRGEHGETWYIDRYYQIQNGHQIEKHIFVGDTRVVTRLEDGDGFDSGYEEHNIFYYHPDHLGSTTFVTTQDGHEWEHMEYTPYGQQWIDEGTDKSIIAYRFTSKEYDSETGLYYYGVRYLDPVTARWMTPDPAFDNFLPATPTSSLVRKQNQSLPSEGGVFNFLNLDPYTYGANNPVKYYDPTGDGIIDELIKAVGAEVKVGNGVLVLQTPGRTLDNLKLPGGSATIYFGGDNGKYGLVLESSLAEAKASKTWQTGKGSVTVQVELKALKMEGKLVFSQNSLEAGLSAKAAELKGSAKGTFGNQSFWVSLAGILGFAAAGKIEQTPGSSGTASIGGEVAAGIGGSAEIGTKSVGGEAGVEAEGSAEIELEKQEQSK